MTEKQRIRLWSFSLFIGFFVMWEVLCIVLNVSDLVLPRPSEILVTLWTKFPILWPHILQTLYSTLIGLPLGSALGSLWVFWLGRPKSLTLLPIPCWLGSRLFPRSPSCRFSFCGSGLEPHPQS